MWAFGCLLAVFMLVALSAAVVSLWLFAFGSLMPGGGTEPSGFGLGRATGLIVLVVGVLVLVRLGRRVRRFTEPLDELVDAVGRVEAGDYTVRVQERGGPGEMRGLAHGFNTMTTRLEADERQRRSLLADVSHELRTPLTVVQGNLEALVDGVYPADEAHLSGILDETRVLSRLVDDLRTLALAESGTLALHREPTDLDVLVAETVNSFRAAADEGGVAIRASVGEDVPLLDVDPVRIREVIGNLIANALRYTPRGGTIEIAAALAPDPSAVRIAVTDSGPGIPSDVLPHVFERFVKSPESRGSGLGLAIARNLVVSHGGQIGVDSAPGRGTTVWFTRPVGDQPGR